MSRKVDQRIKAKRSVDGKRTDRVKKAERELARGNATEHTHHPALKALFESSISGITATK